MKSIIQSACLLLFLYDLKRMSVRGIRNKKQFFGTQPKRISKLEPGLTKNLGPRDTLRKEGAISPYDYLFGDPSWKDQWYMHDLRKVDGPVMDHNAGPVYLKKYFGQSVNVVVMDDGVEEHIDILESYDQASSLTCGATSLYQGGKPTRKNKPTNYLLPGSVTAGVIAMDPNDQCGVGVAPRARIISINQFAPDVQDVVIAKALTYNMTAWHIYSLGNRLSGSAFNGVKLTKIVDEALRKGFADGRGGKGMMYVTTLSSDIRQCTRDDLANHPDTFPISYADMDGQSLDIINDDNRCNALLATTYITDVVSIAIKNEDNPGGCRRHRERSYLSSAIASGIIALVLSANPKLTSHDVMHLIVAGSEVAPLASLSNGWSMNKAGFWYSQKVGFGLLNAENMVNLAKGWKRVRDRHACVLRDIYGDTDKPIVFEREKWLKFKSDKCKGTDNDVLYVENIQVHVSVSYNTAATLIISVISPEGTTAELINYSMSHEYELYPVPFKNRILKCYAFWGEQSKGTWKVRFELSVGIATIEDLEITLYGTRRKPAHYNHSVPRRSYSAFRH